MSNSFVLLLGVSCDVGCPPDVLRNLTALKDMEATAHKRQFDRENKLVEMAEQEKQILREEAERRLCAAKNEYFAFKESAAQEVQMLKDIAEKTKAALSTEFREAREEWAREREKLQQQVEEALKREIDERAEGVRASVKEREEHVHEVARARDEASAQHEKERSSLKTHAAQLQQVGRAYLLSINVHCDRHKSPPLCH